MTSKLTVHIYIYMYMYIYIFILFFKWYKVAVRKKNETIINPYHIYFNSLVMHINIQHNDGAVNQCYETNEF